MATVKFSRDLRDAIIKRAGDQFQIEVNKATESYPTGWGKKIYDIIFVDVLPIMKQLPPEFFSKHDKIGIRSVGGQHVGLQYPLNPSRIFPNGYPPDFRAAKYGSYSDDFVIQDLPELAEFKAEVVEWKARIKKATDRQNEFKSTVSAIVNSYATLAPALKAWPPLWDLVPETTKEIHKKIVERERKEVELGIDLTRATALAAYTKIRDNNK